MARRDSVTFLDVKMAGNMRFFTEGNNISHSAKNNIMSEYQPFPVSVIIAGFCVMSAAYLICFCCCIIQFFLRRGRTMAASSPQVPSPMPVYPETAGQKNDKLKEELWKRFRNSLRKFRKQKSAPTENSKPSSIISCPICFDEYLDPAEVFIGYIKVCGHYFHFDCIWTWLETRQTCPICREKTQLKESDIKGIALRHVKEYQLACLGQVEMGNLDKCIKENGDHKPQSSLEEGVEAEETGYDNRCNNIITHPPTEVSIVIPMQNEATIGTNSQITPSCATADDNSDDQQVATPSSSDRKPNMDSGAKGDRGDELAHAHDNRAFLSGDEVV